jgi:hypothetical protein
MWIWQRNNNPHYQRLIRSIQRKPRGELEPTMLVGLLVGIAANCCVVQGIGSGFYSEELYFYCSSGIVMLMPIFIAIYAAWFTASDTSKPEYELLTLTSLSGKQITWGYINALALRFRVILGFQFGFLLFFIGATTFFILTTALFYEFPYQQEPPRSDYTEAFLLTGLFITIGFIGIYWLTTVTGILVAAATRRLTESVFIATVLAGFILMGWGLAVNRFLEPFYASSPSTRFLPASILLAVIPFTAFWITLRFTYRFSTRTV